MSGLDFLVPYADPYEPWPHGTIKKADGMKMFPIMR